MHVKVRLKPGQVKYFIQGHAASQQQIEEWNPGLLILIPFICLIPASCLLNWILFKTVSFEDSWKYSS